MKKKVVLSASILSVLIVMWYVANYIFNILQIGPNPTFAFSKIQTDKGRPSVY